MATENDPQLLHDRVTRGLALTEEELARLAAWYTQLESEEMPC